MKQITGVVTALATPLTGELNLDTGAFERLLEGQISAGVDGLFILGSVGEGPLFSRAKWEHVTAEAVRINRGRLPLLCGVSDNSIALCLERLHRAAELGAGFGVLTLPYYGWPGRVADGLGFFEAVAAGSPLPLVAYNLPKAVGCQMPLEMIETLFQIPNVICLKDTHGDLPAMLEVAQSPKRPEHFSYLPGNSGFAADLMAVGADGVVSTPANVYPKPFVDLLMGVRSRDTEKIKAAVDSLRSVVKLLAILPTAASAIKCALEVKGICSRQTTPPWPMASEEDMAEMRELLEEIDVVLAAKT
jgi:4-hydroxy-tetrahydrodipicolinate synthase